MNLVTSKKLVRSSTNGGMALPSGIRLYLRREGWSSLVKIGVNFNAVGTIMGTVWGSGEVGRPTKCFIERFLGEPSHCAGRKADLSRYCRFGEICHQEQDNIPLIRSLRSKASPQGRCVNRPLLSRRERRNVNAGRSQRNR